MATVVAVHNYPVLLASLAILPFFHKEGDGDVAVKKNLGENPDLILLVNSDYPLLFPGTYI